jgi:hypothetical protein
VKPAAGHSCEPNLGISDERHFMALRTIDPGEELTFDYSISEEDTRWHMKCACGAETCRRTIGPIQTLPLDVMQQYLPHVGEHFQRVYFRHNGTAEQPAATLAG